MNYSVHLTREQNDQIVAWAKSSNLEQACLMNGSFDENKVFPCSFDPLEGDIIVNRTPRYIDFDTRLLLSRFIFLKLQEVPAVFFVHTHPGFLAQPSFSENDRRSALELSPAFNQLGIQVIEGIVSWRKIGFFMIDSETQEMKEVPFYIDGVLQESVGGFGFTESLKRGFALGRQRAKKGC